MKLEEAIENFCKYCLFVCRLTPETVRHYKQCLNSYNKFLFDNLQSQTIQSLNYNNIEKYISSLSERKLKAWSIIHARQSLFRLCKYLIDKEILYTNPVSKVPKPKMQKTLPEFLTLEQCRSVISNLKRLRQKIIVYTMIFCGLRLNELVNLKIEDINFEQNCMRIYSKGRERIIYFPDNYKSLLLEFLKGRKEGSVLNITKNGLSVFFQRLKKSGKLPVSAHKLRHTYATLMIQGGADLRSIQEMMGHSDIKTTSIYLHCVSEQLKEAAKKHPLG